MPGVVVMDEEGANGASRGKEVQKVDDAAPLLNMADKALPNGDGIVPQLDGPADDSHSGLLTNGAPPSPPGQAEIPSSILDLPPEIQHITTGFQPFSKLIERVTQECYSGVVNVINELADDSLSQPAPAPMLNGLSNGGAVNGNRDASSGDVVKKLRLMEFANRHRERFIKLLVLSQWSRQAGDVSKMIDLWTWYRTQIAHYDDAAEWIGRLRISTSQAKLPNPDIRTALETLSTGKVSWISDLGYIPPEPLRPQQLLKTLRNINTLLSIRLILHDELPPQFKNWSVASGRVTFTVPSEFELDLSIADEDPSSQLYFIDLRLLFVPTADIPDGQFRGLIEAQVNNILAKSGLPKCYEFLHNFILTHKVNILRRQAYELSRGAWIDALKVESLHRSLVVQYWLDVPGSKNWIEIGIAGGQRDDGRASWREPKAPHLAIRWMRGGQEIKEVGEVIDSTNLSLERTLQRIIAMHSSHILRSIQENVLKAVSVGKALSVQLTLSDSEPADCTLDMQLGASGSKITLFVGPVTGRLGFRSANRVPPRLELEINSLQEPSLNAHPRVAFLLCLDLQSNIERQTEMYGWQSLKNINLRPERTKAIFKQEVVRQSFFRGHGWSTKWAVAVNVNLGGDSWWIVELSDNATDDPVRNAMQIPGVGSNGKRERISHPVMDKIERLAITLISFYTTSRELRRLNIPHSLRNETLSIASGQSNSGIITIDIPTLYIKFSSMMKDRRTKEKWAAELLRLSHHGFHSREGKAIHVLKGMISRPERLSKLLTMTHDQDVAFHASGGFALLLRTQFGVPFVDQLANRLKAIERLRNYLETLQKLRLRCERVSLYRIDFEYAPGLSAGLTFAEGTPVRVCIDPSSPHRRILLFLANLLNDRERGFEQLVRSLPLTLPLLRTFDALDRKGYTSLPASSSAPPSRSFQSPPPSIHPRNLDWYRLSYSNPPCTFDIRLRRSRDEMRWHIEDSSPQPPNNAAGTGTANKVPTHIKQPTPQQRDANFAAALKALFRSQGTDWLGLRTSIAAGVDGVEEALKKLDEVVSSFASIEYAEKEPEQPTQSGDAEAGKDQKQEANGSIEPKREVVILD